MIQKLEKNRDQKVNRKILKKSGTQKKFRQKLCGVCRVPATHPSYLKGGTERFKDFRSGLRRKRNML
jgi:hypothetical protein